METSPQPKVPQTDREMVQLVERIIIDVQEGRNTTLAQLDEALKPLLDHVGPFGGSSAELDEALVRLQVAYRRRRRS